MSPVWWIQNHRAAYERASAVQQRIEAAVGGDESRRVELVGLKQQRARGAITAADFDALLEAKLVEWES